MSVSMAEIVEVIGWTGALLVLAAYGAISAKRMSSESAAYQGLNLGGSLCMALYALYKGAFATVAVNVIWLIIAAWALARLLTSRRP
jgi:hypothetical protein